MSTRRYAVVLIAAAFAVASQVAGASAAHQAATRTAAIVCPVSQKRSTCCGPPTAAADWRASYPCCYGAEPAQPICCPPNALCVVPLTIVASPDPSTTGRQVTISGRLSSSASGAQVALWQKLPAQSSFHRVGTTTTSSSGAYSFRRDPRTNLTWYVTSGSLQSITVSELVRAKITLHASTTSSPGRLVLSGHVYPRHTGEQLLVQRFSGGAWVRVAQTQLNASSHYRVSVSFTVGTEKLRTKLPADARNAASVSPTVSVTAVS